MKRLLTEIVLLILGIILFICYLYFCSNDSSSDFSNFSDGLLLGLAIGIIVIGIIMFFVNFKKYFKNKKHYY